MLTCGVRVVFEKDQHRVFRMIHEFVSCVLLLLQ